MILEQTTQDGDYRTIVVDLSKDDGSPFNLMGLTWTIGSQIGMELTEIYDVVNQMTCNTYENLIAVFEANFGDLVVLINASKKIDYGF